MYNSTVLQMYTSLRSRYRKFPEGSICLYLISISPKVTTLLISVLELSFTALDLHVSGVVEYMCTLMCLSFLAEC